MDRPGGTRWTAACSVRCACRARSIRSHWGSRISKPRLSWRSSGASGVSRASVGSSWRRSPSRPWPACSAAGRCRARASRRSMAETSPFDLVLLLIISEATQQALIGDDFLDDDHGDRRHDVSRRRRRPLSAQAALEGGGAPGRQRAARDRRRRHPARGAPVARAHQCRRHPASSAANARAAAPRSDPIRGVGAERRHQHHSQIRGRRLGRVEGGRR